MKGLLDLVGNSAGLAYEGGAWAISAYIAKIKRAFTVFGFGLIAAAILFLIGSLTKTGALFSVGIIIALLGLIYCLLILSIVIIGARVVAKKVPEVGRFIGSLIMVIILWSFIALYVFITHVWEQPLLFAGLLATAGLISIITVLVGDVIDLNAIRFRAKIMLALISMLVMFNWAIPNDFQKKTRAIVTNSIAREILYDATNIDSIEFFDPVTGKPKVWYWLNASTGEYKLFNNDGFHSGSGNRLAPITLTAINDIKRYAIQKKLKQSQEVKKEIPEQPKNQAKIQEPTSSKSAGTPTDTPKPPIPIVLPTKPSQADQTPQNEIVKPAPLDEVEIVIPATTKIMVALEEEVRSDVTQSGQLIDATIVEPIYVDLTRVIRSGQAVKLLATTIKRGLPSEGPSISLKLNAIMLNDYGLSASAKEWSYSEEPLSKTKRIMVRMGIPTIIGTVMGGAVGGKKGAIIGGSIGAAAGFVIMDNTGAKQIILSRGSMIPFVLSEDLIFSKK